MKEKTNACVVDDRETKPTTARITYISSSRSDCELFHRSPLEINNYPLLVSTTTIVLRPSYATPIIDHPSSVSQNSPNRITNWQKNSSDK
jgi:hypothetical protein